MIKKLTEQCKTIEKQITLECVLYVYDTMGWCFYVFFFTHNIYWELGRETAKKKKKCRTKNRKPHCPWPFLKQGNV